MCVCTKLKWAANLGWSPLLGCLLRSPPAQLPSSYAHRPLAQARTSILKPKILFSVFIHALSSMLTWTQPIQPYKNRSFQSPFCNGTHLLQGRIRWRSYHFAPPEFSWSRGITRRRAQKSHRVWSVGAIHTTLGYQSLQYLRVYVGPCILLPSCSLHPMCIVRPSLPQPSASRLFWLHRYLLRCRWHRQPWWPWWPWCSAQLCVPVSQKIKCCIFNAHQKALLDLREWLWPSLFEGFHRSAEPTSGSFDPSSVSAWLGCHVRWLQRTRKPCVVFSPIIHLGSLNTSNITCLYCMYVYIYIILISHYITSKSGNWLVMERRSTNTNKNQLETSWITQMSAAPWEEIPCC